MPEDYQYSVSTHEMTVVENRIADTAKALQEELMLYESAVEIMQAKLHILTKEFRLGEDRSPIDNIQMRVKSMPSIIEKMRRKNYPINLQSMRDNVQDIAGLRVVCPFLSDVYAVSEMLLRQEDVKLLRCKDYIRDPKPNGYRSLHLIVAVTVNLSDHTQMVPVELQIRTIAMNCWASTEHQLRYKKDVPIPESVEESLRQCAELMRLVDEKTQLMADKVFRRQEVLFPVEEDEWDNA